MTDVQVLFVEFKQQTVDQSGCLLSIALINHNQCRRRIDTKLVYLTMLAAIDFILMNLLKKTSKTSSSLSSVYASVIIYEEGVWLTVSNNKQPTYSIKERFV